MELELHVCKVCLDSVPEESLVKHLRSHKMNSVEYFQKYFPRYDRYDGKIILFKSKEHYFSSDFNNKENLKAWLDKQDLKVKKEYCSELLSRRKETKVLIFSPCQVELRSIMVPSVNYLERVFTDYYLLTDSLGFKNRFQTLRKKIEGLATTSGRILIDTREQNPLEFSIPTEVICLKYGDYSWSDTIYSDKCVIERKSVADFWGTMCGGFDRFKREIERASLDGAHLTVLVEGTMDDVKNGKGKSKASHDFVFHRMRELSQKYESLQFLFVNGRIESSRVIPIILTSGGAARKYDLQLAYDCGYL